MTAIKPILFSTPMVQAILDGRKTQTRRICKHQFWSHSELTDFNVNKTHKKVDKNVSSKFQIGDILWVRETWRSHEQDFGSPRYEYKATEKINLTDKWKPSIFMPKEAARIFLKVINVRVERLQEISEQDAIAEGVIQNRDGSWHDYLEPQRLCQDTARASFQSLWLKINGNWNENPWVFVYIFEKINQLS